MAPIKKKSRIANSMKASLEEIKNAASEFKKASSETDEIIDRLELAVKRIEDNWDDAGQQIFYKYYQEWHNHISGFSQLLDTISVELKAIADRYEDADSTFPETLDSQRKG